MSMELNDEKVPVLIVGGGVVGLSAVLCLLQRGVPALLVERHPEPSVHPRSRGINARSGEIFRELGLFETISAAGAALQPAGGIYAGRTLRDAVDALPRRSSAVSGGRIGVGAGMEAWTPTPSCRCTQDILEPLLRQEAVRRGGDVRFHTQLESFTQDAEGVVAVLVDRTSGRRSRVSARYLIAADGAGGLTRERLGIGQAGQGSLGHLLNLSIEADLAALVEGREPSQVLVSNEEVQGLWLSIDNRSRWVLHLRYRPDRGESPDDFPRSRCETLARAALGLPSIPLRVLSALPWEPSVRFSERLNEGCVFLAGDAAHQMPPWGGQGANTGIAEVHNLAWKMAAVLRGLAPPAFLDTYDRERRAVGQFAAAASGRAAGPDGLPRMTPDGKPAAVETMGPLFLAGLGHSYARAATGELDLVKGFDAIPGHRLPHAWVERAGCRISTLDLVGRGFVLLTHGREWDDAARGQAHLAGGEMHCIDVGASGAFSGIQPWLEKIELDAGGAILVRPDGFISWRSGGSENRSRALASALSSALGFHPADAPRSGSPGPTSAPAPNEDARRP